MNILFIWTAPFKNGGGVGRVTTTLGPEFVKMGHNVAYLALCEGEEYTDDGITQYFSPDSSSPVSKRNLKNASNLIQKLDTDFIINQDGIYPKVLNGLNKIKPQRVKILSVHHNCISCLLKHHTTIIKENYKNHTLYPLINNRLILALLKLINRFKYGHYFRNCIKKSDRLILLSEKFIPELKMYVSNPEIEKVTAIPNPVPFETVEQDKLDKENRLLYVGRINFQQKRTDRIIQIWKGLQDFFPGWEFDVLGDGPALNDLQKMALKENLKRIHFHGYTDPRPYLKKAKIFVLTSDFEGFGMVLVEAQTFGVVPIAFNCFSALDEIIQTGENGIVVDAFNMKSYVNSLKELMDNEQARYRMAVNGMESVKRFHPAGIAQKWMALFEDLKL